ncbi:helix-hairpin-helix domain-containing protein [Peptostreptococcus faecalis]|uniref:helix-hairpin-helix domain-containing protein n=1 Tax=Peptostreptococcus faecalis TaxID=2045015 RepID=UPI000C7D1DE1|nr:helix-hairpin-helix domain-containing protein [Peptostreptococcus faecalis]
MKNIKDKILDLFNKEEILSKIDMKKLIVTSVILAVVLCKVFLNWNTNFADKKVLVEDKENAIEATKEDFENKNSDKTIKNDKSIKREDKNEKITIYITGAVANPGVITLESNKRLDDAIKLLGGLHEKADLERINLAMILEDSQHYIIPYKGEDTHQSSGNENEGIANSNENGASDEKHKNSLKNNPDKGKININTADESELISIPGVGPATAKKIINHRENNGKFKDIEGIKDVSGIGDKKYENMKDYIVVK